MLAVQADEPMAFELLMQRNEPRVAAFLQRFVGNRQIAEDLVQEVFLRVYKHRASYRAEAKFTTWLYRIAHNAALNALRAQRRRPETKFSEISQKRSSETTGIGFEDGVMTRSGATPTREIARAEMRRVVRAAVEKLPPRQREALILSRFNGMSYQEVADVMKMTPQAVKSLLCRARLNLKTALTPFVGEQGDAP